MFSCMEAIMQKCISMALNHIHSRTHKSYYLGHFISATWGQKAIRLTAVRSKSFEGEQHRILISAIYIHLSWVGCGTFTTNMKAPYQPSFRLIHMAKYPLLFTETSRLSVGCTLIYISMSRPGGSCNIPLCNYKYIFLNNSHDKHVILNFSLIV